MNAAYRIPVTPPELFQEHGEHVVRIAEHIATNLYGARNRLDLMRECAEHGESERAAKHGKRAMEYAASVRASVKRHGRTGQIAFELAKQMESAR